MWDINFNTPEHPEEHPTLVEILVLLAIYGTAFYWISYAMASLSAGLARLSCQ